MRIALSVVLLVLALGGAGALAAWGMTRAPGESAAYEVDVLGPEGILLHETVEIEEATVLRALQAAAERRGIALALIKYPGMGTYVRAIGGFEAGGANGWVYEVQRDGAWTNGDRSAEYYALQNGDAVRWSWTA